MSLVQLHRPLEYLATTLSQDDADLDLGEAALAVAAGHYEQLDVGAYIARLDDLAAGARKRVRRFRRPEKMLSALNSYLFDDLGFHGDRENYYDPSNSFLNEVLDRRAGLPITLSILYVAIGRRIGLPVAGVGMPLHFIVKYVGAEREIFIDPFYDGEFLTPEQCQQRVESIVGCPIVFERSYLEATPKRVILYRLLNNLKQIYKRRDEPGRAGRVVDQMLVVAPDSPDDIRDRGLLYLKENALSKGIAWLERYLERHPDAADSAYIRSQVAIAHTKRCRLN
jgi:regulator of sirC expression with transglutaminase-like and TPR domain